MGGEAAVGAGSLGRRPRRGGDGVQVDGGALRGGGRQNIYVPVTAGAQGDGLPMEGVRRGRLEHDHVGLFAGALNASRPAALADAPNAPTGKWNRSWRLFYQNKQVLVYEYKKSSQTREIFVSSPIHQLVWDLKFEGGIFFLMFSSQVLFFFT